jgi:hypothetical protein
MHWASKIALPSAEAECIALSQAMGEVLPIICLLEEAKQHGIQLLVGPPKIHCKVFEDNVVAN